MNFKNKALNLRERSYLIVNKPLSIVRLEHSERNKTLICDSLKRLMKTKSGPEMLANLKVFLSDVLPKYNLSHNEMGARAFLLREVEKHLEASSQGGFFRGLASRLGVA